MKWWTDADPWQILTLDPDQRWNQLLRCYLGGSQTQPLRNTLEVVSKLGCDTILVETNYIGQDYRSEYTAFYSQLFRTVPDSAHRLHFYSFGHEKPPSDPIAISYQGTYLGYAVLRPLPRGSVVRACLPPPAEQRDHFYGLVTDHVHLFDREHDAVGMPFMQQDAHFTICAHAAAWMAHQAGALRRDTCPRPSADFALASGFAHPHPRVFPHDGLNDAQINELFSFMEMPSVFHSLVAPTNRHSRSRDKISEELADWLRPYLHSGLPALVAFDRHVVVALALDDSRRELIYHDDQEGPYRSGPIGDLLNQHDRGEGYVSVHVPVPRKTWLPPERAVDHARRGYSEIAKRLAPVRYPTEIVGDAENEQEGLGLPSRAYMCRGTEYKQRLRGRGFNGEVLRQLLMLDLPREVVVVEFYEDEPQLQTNPTVLVEVVCDATYSGVDLPDISWRVGDSLLIYRESRRKDALYQLEGSLPTTGILA